MEAPAGGGEGGGGGGGTTRERAPAGSLLQLAVQLPHVPHSSGQHAPDACPWPSTAPCLEASTPTQLAFLRAVHPPALYASWYTASPLVSPTSAARTDSTTTRTASKPASSSIAPRGCCREKREVVAANGLRGCAGVPRGWQRARRTHGNGHGCPAQLGAPSSPPAAGPRKLTASPARRRQQRPPPRGCLL